MSGDVDPHGRRFATGFHVLLGLTALSAIGWVIHHLVGLGTFIGALGMVVGACIGVCLLAYVVGYIVRDVPQHARRWWE